jgi:hypothetical protein
VNAGSGAERVVVPPLAPLAGVVPVGVDVAPVAVLVVFALVVGVVCESGGALDTVTVFVAEPHALNSNAEAHSAAAGSELSRKRRIDSSYSLLVATLLARRRPSALRWASVRPNRKKKPQFRRPSYY